MNDLPSITLIQQVNARPKSGEELETLGKQAASKYVGGEYSTLNEAVVETVKSAGLSPEQVRRVVEFTNTDAFLQEFRKEGQHKVIEFSGGPANYSDILKDLNDGGGGTVFDPGTNDYELPPPDTTKTAHLNRERMGLESTKLASAFEVKEQPLPFAEPYRDALDMKDKLSAAYDELTSDVGRLEIQFHEAADRLYNQVKQASLSGITLGQIVSAWSHVTDEPVYVKTAFQQMTPRLLSGGVFASKGTIGESLTKTASPGLVNLQHPLVMDFSEYCQTLNKLAQARIVREEIVGGLDQVSTFLKHAAVGGAVGKGAELAKKVWRGATAAAERAAPTAGAIGEEIAGAPGRAILGGAVKYSPHIGLGLVGEEAYQRIRYNPAFQTVKNFLLARVPYTRQAQIRQYSLQH